MARRCPPQPPMPVIPFFWRRLMAFFWRRLICQAKSSRDWSAFTLLQPLPIDHAASPLPSQLIKSSRSFFAFDFSHHAQDPFKALGAHPVPFFKIADTARECQRFGHVWLNWQPLRFAGMIAGMGQSIGLARGEMLSFRVSESHAIESFDSREAERKFGRHHFTAFDVSCTLIVVV